MHYIIFEKLDLSILNCVIEVNGLSLAPKPILGSQYSQLYHLM